MKLEFARQVVRWQSWPVVLLVLAILTAVSISISSSAEKPSLATTEQVE